jgi:hypothetical protein
MPTDTPTRTPTVTRTPTATRTPRALPAITGLTPLSAQQGSSAFTLTVNGIGFANGATVRWNGDALSTTFVSSAVLNAAAPAARLSSAGVAQITVQNPDRNVADAWAFFITENPARVIGADAVTSVDPGGTVAASTGGTTGIAATAQGAGTIAVAQYNANPGGATNLAYANAYMDVNLSPGSTFTQVEVAFCGANSGTQVYWWNGSAWNLASPQRYDAGAGCVIVTVNATTTPSLTDLTGTYFVETVAPTAVSLISFTAAVAEDAVTLRWETAAEMDVVGFNLYRAAAAAGPYVRVNAGLIPAQGDGMTGASYGYSDRPGAGAFYYQLEDVAADGGVTRHGPVGVRVGAAQRIYLPLVTRAR